VRDVPPEWRQVVPPHLRHALLLARLLMLSGSSPMKPDSERLSRLAGSIPHGSAATAAAAARALLPLLYASSGTVP
jgi:hypothetical protein